MRGRSTVGTRPCRWSSFVSETRHVKFPERIVPGAQDLNTALDARDLDADSRFSDQLPKDLDVVRYHLRDRSLLDAGVNEPITIHSRLNVGDVRLNRCVDRYGTEKEVVGDGLPRYWFSLVNRGSVQVGQGAHSAVSSGMIGAALRALPGTKGLSSDDSVRTNLSIEAHALEHVASAIFDDHLKHRIDFFPVVDWSEGLARSVVGLMDFLVADARNPYGLVTNDVALASFNDTLLRALLVGLRHNFSHRLPSPADAAMSAPVRRAEEFMRTHAEKPIRMTDVAVAIGCSLRTLEASFGRARGLTPAAALRMIRLDGVRRLLQKGEVGSVAAAARRYGFTNAGRLAAAYVERFGEHPSDTVRVTQSGRSR